MKMITDRDMEIIRGFSENAEDLLRNLLKRDPTKRLNAEQIKAHAFFADINWENLYAKRV